MIDDKEDCCDDGDIGPDIQDILDKMFDEAEKHGCSIDGCTEPATGIGNGNPYCNKHFWVKFFEEERRIEEGG